MGWTKLEVYNYDTYLGSFYVEFGTRAKAIEEINKKYGKGNWTRFNLGN